MSVALVTGASRGIGAACAVALAQAGFDVAVGYVADEAGANATADAVRAAGRQAAVVQGDISDPTAADAVVSGAGRLRLSGCLPSRLPPTSPGRRQPG